MYCRFLEGICVFANLKLSTKVLITGAVVAIGFPVPLLFWLLPAQRSNGYDMKREATRHVIEAAWGVVNHYGKQVAEGTLTVSQAQAAAIDAIRSARYGEGNYVWINDLRPYMVMHPAKPELNGKDLSNNRDPNGLALFIEAVRICKERGEGEVRYMWPKPGQTQPVPKISYVKLYKPWGWVLGSGVYVDDVEATLRRSREFIFLVTGCDLAGALLLCYFMARSIGRPVSHAASSLSASADQARAAIQQVANASQTIASGLSQQAASIEETSATLEELSSHTRENAKDASHITELMNDVGRVVGESDRHMVQMNSAIQDIDRSAQEVSRIVKAIEEIAFQTNILALNAAVEAARAGAAGAGFSVVADEVRSLAQRASVAVQDTSRLIANSLASSKRGTEISGSLTASLSAIVSKTAETKNLVSRIATSFEQQNEAVSQISSAVSQLNDVTQAQAASSEETASAAAELHSTAESVLQMSLELHAVVEGTASVMSR